MRLKEPEPILPPVNRDLLRAELTPDRKVRDTHKGRQRNLHLRRRGVPRADARGGASARNGVPGRRRRHGPRGGHRRGGPGRRRLLPVDRLGSRGRRDRRRLPLHHLYLGTAPPTSPPSTISASATGSAANTCRGPSSWAARSSSPPTRRAAIRRASTRWTTSGTDWGR